MAPIWHPSPNFGPRRGVAAPDIVVLHYTAMDTAEAALERLCSPEHEVSAHYLIAEDGRLWQLVADADRAWHAGRGAWGRVTDVNSHSIGIELANTGCHPFPDPQMAALERLMSTLLVKWDIPPQNVIAHQDMAPERKQDPGRRFDWRRLARHGLSVWPDFDPMTAAEQQLAPLEATIDALTAAGYSADAPAEAVLAAFRARFRPHATGPCRKADHLLALQLANDFPNPRLPIDPGPIDAGGTIA